MSDEYARLKTWQEFKRLTFEANPDALVYSIDQNAMSKTKELTCLRLILPAQSGCCVYL